MYTDAVIPDLSQTVALIAAVAYACERSLHTATADTCFAPVILGTLTGGASLINRMQNAPSSLPRTTFPATNRIACDANDLVIGGESVRGPVVDMQITEAVASRSYDIRLSGLLHDAIPDDADGSCHLLNELVVRCRDLRLGQCRDETGRCQV